MTVLFGSKDNDVNKVNAWYFAGCFFIDIMILGLRTILKVDKTNTLIFSFKGENW